MAQASSAHLTEKIVSHVLKTAYPSGQPGSFSNEIAELLARLDAVSGHPAPPSVPPSPTRMADVIARERGHDR